MGHQGQCRAYFGSSHPLVSVARRRCVAAGHTPRREAVAGVACGECWERAIRDDERVVVEFDLSRELHRDPSLVDEVAVDRACWGEPVELTLVERRAAVARLADQGLRRTQMARRLRMSGTAINHVCAAVAMPGSAA